MKKLLLIFCLFMTSCSSCVVSDLARIREVEKQFPNHRVTINYEGSSSNYYAIDTLHRSVPVKKIFFYTNSDKISSVQNL